MRAIFTTMRSVQSIKQVLVIFLAIALLQQQSFAEDRPVRIGVIESLTGLAAEDGENVVRALALAAKDLNQAKKRVELLVEDDKSAPKDTVSAYQKLKQSGIDALIVGPYGYTTESVIPLAGRDGIVIFNTSAMHESFNATGSNGYFFNNSISIYEDVKPFIQWLEKNPAKSAVLIHLPSSWGRVQQRVYSEHLAAKQIPILETIETVAHDNNDWGSIITRVAAHKPDIVLLLLNKNDINLFLRKSSEQAFKTRFFGSKNTYDAWRLNQSVNYYEGVCLTYPLKQLHANAKFVEAFKSEFKDEPRIFADTSYDSVRILTEAVEAARETGLSLKDTLKSSKYQGLVGSYDFAQERSFAISVSSLICIEGGRIKLY